MSYDLTEMNRQINSLIRIGIVQKLDAAGARVRVAVGGCLTDWIKWGTPRAGNRVDWSPPRVGEQVMLFAPYGDLTQAVVGFSMYQEGSEPPASVGTQEATVFPDGTTFVYDSESNTYTQTIAGSGNWVFNLKNAQVNTETAEVKATDSITLDSPETTVTGNLTVSKNFTMGGEGSTATINGSVSITGDSLTHNGKNVGSDHLHSGVESGGDNSGVPV